MYMKMVHNWAMTLTAQAIALGELRKPERFRILESSRAEAAVLEPKWSMDMDELAVEIAVSCCFYYSIVGFDEEAD